MKIKRLFFLVCKFMRFWNVISSQCAYKYIVIYYRKIIFQLHSISIQNRACNTSKVQRFKPIICGGPRGLFLGGGGGDWGRCSWKTGREREKKRQRGLINTLSHAVAGGKKSWGGGVKRKRAIYQRCSERLQAIQLPGINN